LSKLKSNGIYIETIETEDIIKQIKYLIDTEKGKSISYSDLEKYRL
jgi:hypothetical protein